jgi:type IV secretion system protein VirD4
MILSVPFGIIGIEPLASYAYSEIAGYPFGPLLWLSGLYHFGYQNQTVILSGAAGLAGGILFPAFVIFVLLPPKPLHGSARLARTAEIRRAQLYDAGPYAILLGRHRGKLLAFNGDLHPFLAAATGTGKGVGFVVPNLLHWEGSAIVLDIKGENFTLTSGYRSRVLKQKVYRFDPLNEKGETHGFNVFDYIRDGELRITDVQTIAAILVSSEGRDPYWDNAARDLMMGLMLLVIEAGKTMGWPVSIGQVHNLLRTEKETGAYLKEEVERIEKQVPLSSLCRRYVLGFCNEPEKPRGSIKSTLATKLTLWANPLVERATDDNDFDFRLFRREPTTLYLAVSPDDLQRLGPLVRLLIEFFLACNTKAGETPAERKEFKVPVLLLLDEFLSLGKMERLVQALAYVRGWGIKIATVIQSEAQLQALYGKELAEFFVDNHRARVYFRPPVHRRDLAEGISKVVGSTTVKQTSFGYGKGPRSRNVSETGQAILDPDEVANLPEGDTIVLVEGIRAMIGEKLIYYRDRTFMKRCLKAAPFPEEKVTRTRTIPVAVAGGVVEKGRAQTDAEREQKLAAIPVPVGMPTEEEMVELAYLISCAVAT